MKRLRVMLVLGLFLIPIGLAARSNQATPSIRDIELVSGEAAVWYLYHNGWAVKTQSALLIFDYWEPMNPPERPSLYNGFINPEEIKGEKVYVFTSHGHGDHYDEKILGWKDSIPDITYVFGWPNEDVTGAITFGSRRTAKKIGPLSIKNIYHEFDGIPESAFLIEVDGLSLYFSGDHGNSPGRLNPVYQDNIDYISGQAAQFDLVFLAIFGSPTYEGELYAVKKFAPNVTLPMHFGDRETQAKAFVDLAESQFSKTKFWYPLNKGEGFLYKEKRIISLTK
jgi:L-ascorbate metabolism protein UlaG (beta-lactamase superfamily)